jgi:alkanesulfonate monooxygenase SsuD/methylene tetrahydromethanopterin reductase-like flavin-dependent oxidoreductase (luciferase family)
MHLGITPWQIDERLDAASLCRQAELAEAWGYDSFFLPESHFAGASSIPDPLMLLAAIAARTEHIMLGTTSWLLPIRNALLGAEQVACLDRLCGGRLLLGLGRGFHPPMLKAFGVEGREKRELFDESLAIMRKAWAGQAIGDPQNSLTLAPLPVQQPHPVLWVAAFGPKALAQVGRLGLPYLASPMETLPELEHNLQLLREAAASAGKDMPVDVPVMRTVFISEDNSACDSVREKMSAQPRPGFARDNGAGVADWAIIGSPSQALEQLQRYRETLSMTHLIAVRPRVSGLPRQWIEASFEALRKLDIQA